ncbi:MAG: nuclear transport factor 2 family protein [Porphyrobacter sp.]|nr:nuclear transport factor 2 family protein [Porphyrobacter sp.]
MTPSRDPLATVQRYVDAFNVGDLAGMVACFAIEGSILDGMAPHLWLGGSAPSDWYRDVLEEGEHLGAGGYFATLGEPAHNVVTGDAAYLVVPAAMTFDLRGQRITQTGATFTFALKQEGGEWRIAAWAWAKGKAG